MCERESVLVVLDVDDENGGALLQVVVDVRSSATSSNTVWQESRLVKMKESTCSWEPGHHNS